MSNLSLEIVEGPGAGRQVPLDGSLEIGRDPDAGLVLDDPQVSRRHARISPAGGAATVEDLGSSNGTFLNGNELHAPARVDPGDELVIGVTVMELRSAAQIEAQPSAVRAVPPALAAPERQPSYVAPVRAGAAEGPAVPELDRLIDTRTKSLARTAPVAVFVLVVIVLLLYFGTR